MLRDSCSRVRSMAQIHQTLYQSGDVSQVDLGYFLDVLVASLSGSYAVDADKITIASQVDNVHLAIEQAVPCGLIANELISNCLKHAFPGMRTGQITIEARSGRQDGAKDGGRSVCLSVSDTGIGLPDDLDIENGGSLGLHLVHMLVDQLGGTIDVHRHAPARITIEFPQGSPNA
jgi:two-component sensor histidine kinase